MSKERNQYHVVPNSKKGGWDLKKANGEKAIKHCETKKECVDYGRPIAKNQGAEFVQHKKNGQIHIKDSYGNDPNPPKDKNL